MPINFIKFANEEYWSQDDRFSVVPTPDGWVAMDFGRSNLPHRGPDVSHEVYDTHESAQAWCEARIEQETNDVTPCAVVGG